MKANKETNQGKRLQRLEAIIIHLNDLQRREIPQGEEVIIEEGMLSDSDGFEFRTVGDSETTVNRVVAWRIHSTGMNESVLSNGNTL